jgi:hypothetical protein
VKTSGKVGMSADSLTRSLQTPPDQDHALVVQIHHFSLTEHYFNEKKWWQTDHRQSHS